MQLQNIYTDLPLIKEESYSLSKFSVTLDSYAGQFDALLDMIEKETIDVLDIALTQITKQYLDYFWLKKNEDKKINLSLTSEFLLIASYLLETKSRLILPNDEEEEIEEIETSLIDHLALYKLFKAAASVLKERKELFAKVFHRAKIDGDNKEENQYFLKDIEIQDLAFAFKNLLVQAKERTSQIEIVDELMTVEEKIDDLKNLFAQSSGSVVFNDLFKLKSCLEIIVTFLALLELIRQKFLGFKQMDLFGNIIVYSIN